ncbi:MAG: c-type cytochrome [Pseudomonadota bacterium]
MKTSFLPFAMAVLLTSIAACGTTPGGDDDAMAADTGKTEMSGMDAYMAQCAGCHETGLQGAPIVGDKAYWESRSKLWKNVLVDHAKTGYLDMPARGGRQDLSDATIEAAVDYMLSLTYPDGPPGE